MAQSAEWIAALLTTRLVLVMGTIAVATLGFTLLTGRVPAKRALGVLAGIAVVSSANSLARVLIGAGATEEASLSNPPVSQAGQRPTPKQPPPAAYDPYAGAAVPSTQGPENDPFRSN